MFWEISGNVGKMFEPLKIFKHKQAPAPALAASESDLSCFLDLLPFDFFSFLAFLAFFSFFSFFSFFAFLAFLASLKGCQQSKHVLQKYT